MGVGEWEMEIQKPAKIKCYKINAFKLYVSWWVLSVVMMMALHVRIPWLDFVCSYYAVCVEVCFHLNLLAHTCYC